MIDFIAMHCKNYVVIAILIISIFKLIRNVFYTRKNNDFCGREYVPTAMFFCGTGVIVIDVVAEINSIEVAVIGLAIWGMGCIANFWLHNKYPKEVRGDTEIGKWMCLIVGVYFIGMALFTFLRV